MDETTYLHSLESIPLSKIVKEEYRTYQIYTLMDRAIPYLQDGLKPSQRRILWTLFKHQSKGLMKVSSSTGLVLTLHPHGPASVESAIVNMAQDFTFTNNYPLIDKKGYFGERMETSAAASRYIECKLGKIAEMLLFDDLNQVNMIPNYDETCTEPEAFLPKLPIMLLNGAEGIGTGFSSVIPSFHHAEIIDSMIHCVENGKPKKMKPYVHTYTNKIDIDPNGKLIFKTRFEEIDGHIYITELPKGYDSEKIYKYLTKFVDSDYIKDFIDSSVSNEIKIELVFKRGQTPKLSEIEAKMGITTSVVPNYTLISERGVKIFQAPEEIIEIFTKARIHVVKRRYELLAEDYTKKIAQNSEIIRFIKEKHYAEATKQANRKSYVEYLQTKKFNYFDYLADMPIYRMTLEEVNKRQAQIKEDTTKLQEVKKIAASDLLVKKKLILELTNLREDLSTWLKDKDLERKKLLKNAAKVEKKKVRNS